MKIQYVLGFLRHDIAVVLVKKNKPEFMKGFWNGIGGSIEDGESPADAMMREAEEEANLNVDWNLFTILHRPKAIIYCFWAECDKRLQIPEQNDIGERQAWIGADHFINLFESVPVLLELIKLKPTIPAIIHLGEPK